MPGTPTLREDSITIAALQQMPQGFPRRIEITKDMSGKTRRAVVWSWYDRGTGAFPLAACRRLSYFDAENGEYLGEAFE